MSIIKPTIKVDFEYDAKKGVWTSFSRGGKKHHLNIKEKLLKCIGREKLNSALKQIIKDTRPPYLIIAVHYKGSLDGPPAFEVHDESIKYWASLILARLSKK